MRSRAGKRVAAVRARRAAHGVAHLVTRRVAHRVAHRVAPLLLVLLAAPAADAAEVRFRDEDRARVVSRDELRAAMQLQRGFDITATTNGSRFQAGVILELARRARERDPHGPPLRVGHDDSFFAFLAAAGLPPERAPIFVAEAHRHKQDQLIEYRAECGIHKQTGGAPPRLAVTVKAWWPDGAGLGSSFSYLDTFSRPQLQVTNQRLITYRLVAFPDMLVYDGVQGVSGRPTTGLLGVLFRIIGDGQVVRSRSALADDGVQVIVAQTRKGPISLTATVTIRPDGSAEKDVPAGRPDLAALARRLERPPVLEYVPLGCPP